MGKVTTENFIEKIKRIHGNRFDYSKVKYVSFKTPVCLIDKDFGNLDLWVTPEALYKGSYVRHSMKTFEEFVFVVESKYPGKYDYSLAKEVLEKEFKGNIIIKESRLEVPIINKETGNIFYKSIYSLLKNNITEYMSFETFLKEAKEIYGDYYDFSQVEWKNKSTPITIICPEHGPFITTVVKFLDKKIGCPKCRRQNGKGKRGKLCSQEEVLERFHKVHGDRYDYSKVIYKGMDKKVEIICPVHGPFWQTPFNHLKESGCSKCNKGQPLNLEEFLKRAYILYGDLYDYSMVKIGKNTKVRDIITIICKKHGPFEVSIYNFLYQNSTCPLCREEAVLEKRSKEFKEFLQQAKEIHGDRYDYSKVVWKNKSTPVEITCKVHGSFWQAPTIHLKGANCPKCVKEEHKLNNEKFIEKARKIHGDKYDYSKVNYINSTTPVEIICPDHGSFWMTPKEHLRGNRGKGRGCPYCNEYSGETKIRTWLENQKIEFDRYKKYEALIYKRTMNTDFYIESCNLAIEYQGHQHYHPVTYGRISLEQAQLNFEETIARDRIKEKYFSNSDIDLLCIHYKDYNKIDEILQKIIIEKDYNYLYNTNSYMF